MAETIGFVGLGDLGAPVAGNLLDAGYGLRVWNRTVSKADALVARGAERAATPADAASPGGIVVSLLWDDASVESVVASDGFLDQLAPGGVHISMSTITPEASKRLAALHAARGSTFVEAPIFGRPEAAAARQLWIPFAGPAAAKERVRPLLDAMGAQGVFDFGEEIGAATMVKLVGNFMIIAMARSIGEGVRAVAANGFDPKATIEMLTQTLFDAPIFRSYGRALATGAAAPVQSAIPEKDLGLFQRTAALAGAPTPISGLLLKIVRAP